MKISTQQEITIVTEKTIVENIEEDLEWLASMGMTTVHAKSYNASNIKGTIDQYKDKMAHMKETLKKEEIVGREAKRKYDSTLSNLDNVQRHYHILEEETDALKLWNTILDGKEKDIESKMEEIEIQRTTANKQAAEYNVRLAELEP